MICDVNNGFDKYVLKDSNYFFLRDDKVKNYLKKIINHKDLL